MHRSRKKRNIIIFSLIGVLLCMTIGYAAYSTNLKISGTSKVTSNWDIRITNVTSGTPTGTAENAVAPSYTNLTASMEANLYEKGDSMEYDVTIENKGTIDAKLNDIITNIEKANSDAVNITFSGYTKGEKLLKGTAKVIHVKIEYNPTYEGGKTSSEIEVKFDYTQNNNETEAPENTFLVTYDCITNGGNDCSSNNEYLVSGSNIDLTKTGTKDKYDFIGWNTNKDEAEGLTSLTVEQNDITLYAIFKAKDTTPPIIDSINTSSTTNSITAVVAAHDDESNISKYEFSINNGEYIDNGTSNVYTFTNLTAGTAYTIKVRVTNGVGMQSEKEIGNGLDLSENIVTSGDGLYKDEYESEKYTYKGTNPNNYILFNDELWRIVSLDKEGNYKIIRSEPLETRAWDTSNSNKWNRPATINTYLNNEYLNSITNNFDNIISYDWSIGSVAGNDDLVSQIEKENKEIWNGKIGLITASEYLRANSNITQCETLNLNNDNSSTCKTTNWIFNIATLSSLYMYTITPYDNENYNVFVVDNNRGIIGIDGTVADQFNSAPVLNLTNKISLKGEGSKENPFQIIDKISTPLLEKPTFTEKGVYPKTVTIKYPEGCGSNLTCTYQKDNGTIQTVKNETVAVEFNDNGSLVATVTDGTNTETSTYNVKVGIDITENITTTGDGLYEDEYEEGRLVYKGANPNNYITFNDELWRIMSVETDGTMKIVKSTNIGTKAYDEPNTRPTTTNTYCKESGTYGCNVWAKIDGNFSNVDGSITGTVTEDSSLNTYLNEEYYDTLSLDSKAKIANGKFNIGVINTTVTKLNTAITQEKAYTWNGKIGLINTSDYIKASTNSACVSTNYAYNNKGCATNNYIYKSSNKVLTLNGRTTNSRAIIYIKTDGTLANQATNTTTAIFPALYLKSGIKIISGDGSKTTPYELEDYTNLIPTFEESGTTVKTVTITYPNGCGDTLTCTYQKDNGEMVNVISKTATVEFSQKGTLIATVNNGKNSISNSYNVKFCVVNDILNNVEIVTSGDGLYEDEYEEGRYIYKGENPNNYITFNDEKAGWRIISVECNGSLKIMRREVIGDISWDNSGSNNWNRPATLNTYLNDTYYNNLNETAKSQIVLHDFSIGAVTKNNNNLANQVKDENSKKWNGKIALPTLSELIRTNNNKSLCGTFYLMNKNISNCNKAGWTDNGHYTISHFWTLSADDSSSSKVFNAQSNGYVQSDFNLNLGVKPVLYLSPDVKIIEGEGTSSNPFTLS